MDENSIELESRTWRMFVCRMLRGYGLYRILHGWLPARSIIQNNFNHRARKHTLRPCTLRTEFDTPPSFFLPAISWFFASSFCIDGNFSVLSFIVSIVETFLSIMRDALSQLVNSGIFRKECSDIQGGFI